MAKRFKRAFTIVELVIVIAVIAILAAVLIPTFTTLIDKANESADLQAVQQMNTILAANSADEDVENISDVIEILAKEDIDIENYKPLSSNRQFYWVKSINRIVYADANYEVVYPENYKDLVREAGQWFSLSGEIKQDDSWKENIEEESGAVVAKISSGEQFASFVKKLSEGDSTAKTVEKISLQEDIDLSGATYKFLGDTSNSSVGFSQNLTIDGNNHTLYGYRDDSNAFFGSNEFENKGYGYGLFYSIGKDATVTLKNITLSDAVAKDTIQDTGTMGLIAGYVYGTLNLENVTIKNSYIEGRQKIGGIVGQLYGALSINGLKMENVEVVGSVEVAKIASYVTTTGKFKAENVDVEGVTVKVSEEVSPWDYMNVFAPLQEISASKIVIDGKAETGTLYIADKAKYIWTVSTDDYYWKVVKANCVIDGENYYLPSTSASEDIL